MDGEYMEYAVQLLRFRYQMAFHDAALTSVDCSSHVSPGAPSTIAPEIATIKT